jgi:chromosome segregation ATPase
MKKNDSLKLIIFGICFGYAPTALSQVTAQSSILKLEQNLEKARKNLEEFNKNLGVASGNLEETAKTKTQLDTQAKETQNKLAQQKSRMELLKRQESDIARLSALELKGTQEESKKIAELEALIAKLRNNIQLRQKNLSHYKTQSQAVEKDKSDWTNRGLELDKSLQSLKKRQSQLGATETEWSKKKKAYELQVIRWEKETARHQKLLEDAKALAESQAGP